MPPEFDKQRYWHHRFLSETAFEWLASSETFLEVAAPFLRHLPRDAPILQLGCGTSDLHIHLRRQGFDNVTNIDFEPLAIERSQAMERHAFGDTRNKYLVADVLTLDLGTKFDIVLDKSTADAIACSEGPSVLTMADRVRNHLTENGAWLSLSFSASRFQVVDGTLPLQTEVIGKLPHTQKETYRPGHLSLLPSPPKWNIQHDAGGPIAREAVSVEILFHVSEST